eukprot:3736006-Pleurochrysis_carterae.AAC.1
MHANVTVRQVKEKYEACLQLVSFARNGIHQFYQCSEFLSPVGNGISAPGRPAAARAVFSSPKDIQGHAT